MAKQHIEPNKEKVTLEITLKPVRVTVEKGNGTEKELIDNIMKVLPLVIERERPCFNYAILDDGSLSFDTIYCGMLVEEVRSPHRKGIVTSVNKKTVNVTVKGNIALQGNPAAFKPTNLTFEEVASFYKPFQLTQTDVKGNPIQTTELDVYSLAEGLAGYMFIQNEYVPVVFGKAKGNLYILYTINNKGKYFSLPESSIKSNFKASKPSK